ncbi:DUF3626 domain-containing protein [Vibrio fortis]|uniref:DUF3626 domain-containing protein n=1 Tax=Vibrio fortis TaxID=212667 RepID=UPI00406857F6
MTEGAIEQAIANIRSKSCCEEGNHVHAVTINFHPDRYTSNKTPLLQAIARDGKLKSQFETSTSNGGLTAYTGGARWIWEQSVFDGAYDDAADHLRPKYGALNFREYPSGAAARFGSSYFELKPHVLERTTFCYPDSFFKPTDFAIASRLQALIDKASSDDVDLLDDYIEAHVHGEISLKEDVECIVLDPAYRETGIERYARNLGIPVKWHNGFKLSVEEIARYPEYRGKEYIELAKELSQDGVIDPRILGLAVTEKGYDEQDVKKVWHYLARFGYQSLD